MPVLMDDKAIEAIVAMLMDLQERENINLPLYEQQLRDVERTIENLLDAIQQGIFTKATKGRLDELESTKEDLEIRIANEKIAKPKLTEDKIKHFLYRFRVLDMSKEKHRRMLIDMFINRIYLYDDKLVITFNHKDGAETITLEDVETALAEAGFGSDLVSLAVPNKREDTLMGILSFISPSGRGGTRTIKCKCPVDTCLMRARPHQHLNFCPGGAEMLRVPSGILPAQ